MSPLRWDVLAVGLLLALPVLALGARGDFSADEVVVRLPWCLLAAWGAVVLLRWAVTPPRTPATRRPAAPPSTDEPAPAP